MNSTDPDDLEAALAALFDHVLLPISQRMQAEGAEAFPRGPDASCLSYFVRRGRSSMQPGDFSGIACRDGGEFGQRLAAHWEGLGRHELASHVHAFATVAEIARTSRASTMPSHELSPYVYAMF